MDEDKFRKLELEIEEVNRVKDEGEKLDTVDGFRKYVKKQLDKISGKSDKARGASAHQAASTIVDAQDRGQGDEDVDAYDFTYPERGLAIIINNEDFHLSKEFGDRPGSSYDATALYETFKNLGFKVWVKDNLTAWQMVEVLKLGKNGYDHASADCFVCAILSHGNETFINARDERFGSVVRKDMLFGVDGKGVATSVVMELFSDKACPGLIGKPRLFFIQACRGEDYDDGVDISIAKQADIPEIHGRYGHDKTDHTRCLDQSDKLLTDQQKSGSDIFNSTELQTLPADAQDAKVCASEESQEGGENRTVTSQSISATYKDATDGSPARNVPVCPTPLYKDSLIMYATPPGHFAWRRKTGAWFVQSLCSVLDSPETGQKSLINVLVQVVGMVARNYQSENPSRPYMHQKKETPVIESMLVKDIFLTRKEQA